MIRKVSFHPTTGNIVVEGEAATEVVHRGTVLIDSDLADEARTYGWEIAAGHPSELELGLVRAKR